MGNHSFSFPLFKKLSAKSLWIVFLLTFMLLSISIIETLAYRKVDPFPFIGSRIWLVWTIFYTVISLFVFGKTIFQEIKGKQYLGIFSLIFVTILVSFNLHSYPIDISGESTLQAGAALENIKKSDFGYTETAFLGYPSRQYLVTTWPSMVFGRSIVNYRLGYLLVFLLGIYLFYAGIKTCYSNRPQISQIATLGILSLLSFPIVLILLRIFEQTILPISFTYQALGWFLIVLKRERTTYFLAFIWILTMLATNYTPSLSIWVLFTTVAAVVSMQKMFSEQYFGGLIFLLCLLTSIVFGINSIQFRQDLKLTKPNISPIQQMEKIPDTFEYFLVKNVDMYNNQVLLLGPLMFLPVLLYLVGGILNIWGAKHLLLILWIFATIIISGISPGYANPQISFGIHRATVVFPFLILAFVDIISSRKDIKIPVKYILLLSMIISLYDIYYVYSIYKKSAEIYDIRSVALRETLETTGNLSISPEAPIKLGIFTTIPQFVLFPDHLKYFYPNTTLIPEYPCPTDLNPASNLKYNEKTHRLTSSPVLIYLEENHKCYNDIMNLLSGKKYSLLSIQYEAIEIDHIIKPKRSDSIQKIIIK